ncbi:helicase HerA domain-containing protein [Microbacterium forte]
MTALSIGMPLDSGLGTVTLDPRRFNRHTFWCGQSGSGKTYALGVVLEQLLLETELPMLILDPNADLIVIDEAHNLCPPDPRTEVERALTEQLVQIAAEGRKFGLWLFLSTQRPTKIHPNVLSQCDNLGLMRVNAPRDLAELAEVFGFAPEEAIRRSQTFTQGQALFAGGFIAEPTFVQMGERLTEEAGGDVSVPLRSTP